MKPSTKFSVAFFLVLIMILGVMSILPVKAQVETVELIYSNDIYMSQYEGNAWEPVGVLADSGWGFSSTTSTVPPTLTVTFDKPIDPEKTMAPSSSSPPTYTWEHSAWNGETETFHGLGIYMLQKPNVDAGLRLNRALNPALIPPGVSEVTFDFSVEVLRQPTIDGSPAVIKKISMYAVQLSPGNTFETIEILSVTGSNIVYFSPINVGQKYSHSIRATVNNHGLYDAKFMPTMEIPVDVEYSMPVITPSGELLNSETLSLTATGPIGETLDIQFSKDSLVNWKYTGGHAGLKLWWIGEVKSLSAMDVSSAWKVNEVTLDGAITNPDEWSESSPYTIPLTGMHGDSLAASFWFMNDGEWVYVLERVPWSKFYEGEIGHVSDIGYAYSGDWGTISCDEFGIFANETTYDWNFNPVYTDDVLVGGQNNTQGYATHDGTYYWFEYRKLLNSGDGYDFSWTLGGTYDLSVGFWNETERWYENWNLDLTLATEPQDALAPTSSISVQGWVGEYGWYVAGVNVAISAIDEGGSGWWSEQHRRPCNLEWNLLLF